MKEGLRPIKWMGSALATVKTFPEGPRAEMGHALYFAQRGEKHLSARPLKGFGGASVLEVVQNYDGNTYRAVYTVKFEEAVYVLHCFQKKSKSGIATPKQDMDLVRSRLRIAELEHKKWQEKHKPKG